MQTVQVGKSGQPLRGSANNELQESQKRAHQQQCTTCHSGKCNISHRP